MSMADYLAAKDATEAAYNPVDERSWMQIYLDAKDAEDD